MGVFLTFFYTNIYLFLNHKKQQKKRFPSLSRSNLTHRVYFPILKGVEKYLWALGVKFIFTKGQEGIFFSKTVLLPNFPQKNRGIRPFRKKNPAPFLPFYKGFVPSGKNPAAFLPFYFDFTRYSEALEVFSTPHPPFTLVLFHF